MTLVIYQTSPVWATARDIKQGDVIDCGDDGRFLAKESPEFNGGVCCILEVTRLPQEGKT